MSLNIFNVDSRWQYNVFEMFKGFVILTDGPLDGPNF